jgi:hypothetical protein
MTMILGRPTPDPRLGSSVELSGRDAYGLLNLVGSGKALSSQSIAAQEAPPALLQIQPAGSRGDKDVMEAGMLGHPGAGLSTIMTAQIIRDNENVTPRIISFDVLKKSDIVCGVA